MKLYTESELTALPLAQVKKIADALGTRPVVDRRFKKAWILVILRKQSKVVIVSPVQPQITPVQPIKSEPAHTPAIESTSYTDCAELELSEAVQLLMLTELDTFVNELDPEDGEGTFEIVRNGRFMAFVDGCNTTHTLRGCLFHGNVYSSPEAAAIAWLEIHCPGEVLLALATAQQAVLERSALFDYV